MTDIKDVRAPFIYTPADLDAAREAARKEERGRWERKIDAACQQCFGRSPDRVIDTMHELTWGELSYFARAVLGESK